MDSRVLPIPQVSQLDMPFCLYACTSMTLKYFGIDKSMQDVASEVFLPMPGERVETFAETAGALKDYFRDHGLEAKYYRNQDWNDLKAALEKGNAIIAFVKSHPDNWEPNHSWILRGFDQTSEQKVIYNNPRRDPGDADPITFDYDGDEVPGETMLYDSFLNNYWNSPLAAENQSCLVVSYPGQGMGHDYDWRTSGPRNATRFTYHAGRLIRAVLLPVGPIKLFTEVAMTIIGFVALIFSGVQLIGQLLEAAGKWLINKGNELIRKGGLATVAGIALVATGAVVAGVGYIVDFVAGVAGTVLDFVTNVLDGIGSIFSGSGGGSTSEKLGDTNVNLSILLHVEPWQSRVGSNWEKISGSWTVAIEDFSSVDELKVWWKVNVWGWGIDDWDLRRSILESSGTIVQDLRPFDGKHHKNFYVEMNNAQGIRMSFGEDKCHYGYDGGLTRVNLEVEVRAICSGQSVKLSKSDAVYGLSV